MQLVAQHVEPNVAPCEGTLSLTTRRTALTKDEKFRDFLLLVCKDMADIASNEGKVSYSSKVDTIHTLLQLWKEGKQVLIMGVTDANRDVITVGDENDWINDVITVPDERTNDGITDPEVPDENKRTNDGITVPAKNEV